jgi:hypothetical protein
VKGKRLIHSKETARLKSDARTAASSLVSETAAVATMLPA